jgi:hypothetical protein
MEILWLSKQSSTSEELYSNEFVKQYVVNANSLRFTAITNEPLEPVIWNLIENSAWNIPTNSVWNIYVNNYQYVDSLCKMGTGGSFPGGKEAGAWSWPLTSN